MKDNKQNFAIGKAIALTVVLFLCIRAAAQELIVRPVATLESMPSSLIDVIFEDSRGYMWYATDNGVYRDDGYKLQFFSIGHQQKIYSIVEDKSEKLWIATYKGIYILDINTYELTYFEDSHVKDLEVRELFCDDSGSVWAATFGHLQRFDRDGNWKNSYLTFDRRNEQTFMSGMLQGSDGTIYMTSYSHGIYQYNVELDGFVYMGDAPGDLSLTKMIQDNRSPRLWVVTSQAQIVCFDPYSLLDSGKRYICSDVHSTNPASDDYRDIHYMIQDRDYGYLWVTTHNNLLTFKTTDDGLAVPIDNMLTNRLKGKMLQRIISTKEGMFVSGLDCQCFRIYLSNIPSESDDLASFGQESHYFPYVTACLYNEANPDILWMFLPRTGFVMYNRATGEMELGTKIEPKYADTYRKTRLHTPQKMSWSPSFKGVWEVSTISHSVLCVMCDGKTMRFVKQVVLNDVTENTEYITCMAENNAQLLWLGTTQGVFRYNLTTDKFENHYQEIGHVMDLKVGRDEDIWAMTTDNGLYHFLPNAKLEHHCDNMGFTLMDIDANGQLWLANDKSEVFCYNAKEQQLIDYTEDCQTRNCFISQIIVDDSNCPWIITDKAIIQFNPKTHTSRWHMPKDFNSPVSRFEAGCLYKGSDGMRSLCFAGVGGFTILPPSNHVEVSANHVKSLISDVRYSDRSAIYDDVATSKDGVVSMPANAYNVEITFSTLCHRYIERVRYAYKMEDLDHDWVYTKPGENKAFYNKLPKGTHKFLVRASDENGLWSDEVTTLLIYRQPWWYETWWAYSVYALLFAAAVFLLVRYYIGRAMKKSNQMWAESKQMIEMREYLSSREPMEDEKFLELDRILLDKITATIEEHIGEEDFDINLLASEMGMSRSTLFRKIKSITGKTPVELVRSLKMQRACRLLHDKDRNINEVAYMVGYFDRRQFTAVFKREIGVTPSLYQKQLLEENAE